MMCYKIFKYIIPFFMVSFIFIETMYGAEKISCKVVYNYGIYKSNDTTIKFTKFVEETGNIYFDLGFSDLKYAKGWEFKINKYYGDKEIKYNYIFSNKIDTIEDIIFNKERILNDTNCVINQIDFNYLIQQYTRILSPDNIYELDNINNEINSGSKSDTLPINTYHLNIIENNNYLFQSFLIQSRNQNGYFVKRIDSFILSKQSIKQFSNLHTGIIKLNKKEPINTANVHTIIW